MILIESNRDPIYPVVFFTEGKKMYNFNEIHRILDDKTTSVSTLKIGESDTRLCTAG
jgi:hypothetical protein